MFLCQETNSDDRGGHGNTLKAGQERVSLSNVTSDLDLSKYS